MRGTDLLEARVVDSAGADLGAVRDARVHRAADGHLAVVGIVVGGGRFAHAAHAWGFAEGRTHGPWLFRALTAGATRAARYVPAARVLDWGPRTIRIDCPHDELEPLRPELFG